MGLYRTIPVDVHAVQYTGIENDTPKFDDMGANPPGWFMSGIYKGVISFSDKGVTVGGAVLNPTDWVIFDGAFFDVMADEKFHVTFTKARKPQEAMASAPKSLAQKKAKKTASALGAMAQADAKAGLIDPIPPTPVVTPVAEPVTLAEPFPDTTPIGHNDMMGQPSPLTTMQDADRIIDKLISQSQ